MKAMTLLLIGLVGLAIAIAALCFVVANRGPDIGHIKHTLATGVPASARVLALRDTGGRLNGNPAIEFRLDVQPADGAPYTATAHAIISTVALPRYQPGASIAVKYDAADRSKVAIVQE